MMIAERTLGLEPIDLGLPVKYHDWRPGQESALLDVAECDERFHALAMPTGWGKSVFYIAAAQMLGLRCCVLTSTKALQDQLLDDFGPMGMVDVRGRGNYECCLGGGYTCDEGRHARCPRQKSSKCPYRYAYNAACQSDLVVTNYSYWIYQNLYGEGLGNFDLLVCDEAHDAPEEICSAVAVRFTTKEIYGLLSSEFPKTRDDMDTWIKWAYPLIKTTEDGIEEANAAMSASSRPAKKLVRELADWRNLLGKLKTVASATGDWAIQDHKYGVSITPLWPSVFAEQVLFRGIPKIFMTSATIRPKTLELMGVSKKQSSFREYPAIFDPRHSPVFFMKTNRIRVDRNITNGQRQIWMNWIDWIIRDRLDRKGIVHSVSYKARDYIMEHSEYRELMVTHTTATAIPVVKSFMAAEPPLILVSPSVTTGWDFKYDLCRYQILTKCPWPNLGDKVLILRMESDPEYAMYIMAQQIVQAFGRANRAEDDFCENFLTDWGFARFASRKCPQVIRDLFPAGFWNLLSWMDRIPVPPSLGGLKLDGMNVMGQLSNPLDDDIPF